MAQLTLAEYLAQAPVYGTEDVNKWIRVGLAAEKTSIELSYKRDCPVCGAVKAMYQHGVLSTGLPLEHYTPTFGEVLKNIYMWCSKCGAEQGS